MGQPGEPPQQHAALRLLIDTNVFIALEPYAGQLEAGQAPAARLVRLVHEQRHRLFVHPATSDDLRQGDDDLRRTQRLAELEKFSRLEEVPVARSLTDMLGTPQPGSNDDRDLRLLAAVQNKAVTYLITEDGPLRRRAARVGLGERLLTIADAVAMLEQLTPLVAAPPPRVRAAEPYTLDGDQDLFASLRGDYDGFDAWLDRVRADSGNRDCLIVEEEGKYAALAILKRHEPDCLYGFDQPVMKIATLKVGSDYLGRKYGELLLKAIFGRAHDSATASLYVEVLPRHESLIELLHLFGFAAFPHPRERGEQVLLKRLRPQAGDAAVTSGLDFHITFGPPAVAPNGPVYLVPIEPKWHGQLFPDAPPVDEVVDQPTLPGLEPPVTHPWGNALRKAYLSQSRTGKVVPGGVILFYQSHGPASVTAVGVVEETLRSTDAAEVAAFVGQRTVYKQEEIVTLCRSVTGVLATLFRQDRFIEPAWTLEELVAAGVCKAAPQSIMQVKKEGALWVRQQLAE